MKHAVARKKTASPLPRKSYSEPKKSVAETVKKVAEKSPKSNSAKAVSVKSKFVADAKSTDPKITVPKNKITVKSVKTAVAVGKQNSGAAKPKAVAPEKNLKPNAKKIAPKAMAKTTKVAAQKTKPTITAKQKTAAKTVAAKAKPKTAKITEKPKTGKTAPKISAMKTSKKHAPAKIKTAPVQKAKDKAQTAKIGKTKTVKPDKPVAKIQKKPAAMTAKKAAAPKIKLATALKKVDQKSPKSKLTATGRTVRKSLKAAPEKPIKTIGQSPKQMKLIVAKTKIQTETSKAKTPNAPRISKPSAVKTEEKISVKIRNGRLVLPPLVKIKGVAAPVEATIEAVETPVVKPRKRKLKSFGSAIFRGQKQRYDFQVFPVDGEFEDSAAVFIISRRVVDRHERAHHRMVCIGQTASVLKELKKHRKGKCFKQHHVNAVSVLREEDEQKRLKIEADLKSAHRIPCPH